MTVLKSFILAALCALTITAAANAAEKARLFLDGIAAYRSGDYDRAVEAFGRIADSGVENAKLYYNLANAYLKNDDLGRAVQWYEKALKLTPNDPDLKFNYAYAVSLTKDEKGEKELPLTKILFFWKHHYSAKTIQYAAIILNALFWLCLLAAVLLKKPVFKTSAFIILFLSLTLAFTAAYNYYESYRFKQGIILPPQVSIRSGLTKDSTELFRLHAGTKVRIEKENKSHFRIFFSSGKIGWIKKQDLGVI
jgi:tetratricopeptide (TPR) repeat protein